MLWSQPLEGSAVFVVLKVCLWGKFFDALWVTDISQGVVVSLAIT